MRSRPPIEAARLAAPGIRRAVDAWVARRRQAFSPQSTSGDAPARRIWEASLERVKAHRAPIAAEAEAQVTAAAEATSKRAREADRCSPRAITMSPMR